ncbi:hypothetical protein J1N09_06395 [Aureitalea sp. L0-47]|uniref:hypothetical protein n=1 Tax=Aureitalea sp. L0-47 TaxID=2816962 RepID=UPI00223858BA|nr:hypothetical protein [Aureitalea sp. L0-47]MCW5519459.1 hypothetical protein [Aureitalea sp. L0-47]
MRTITTLLLVFVFQGIFAQVGIGTVNPQADLHVGGDLLIRDNFTLGSLNTVNSADEDFMLLSRSTTSTPTGKITKLDVSALSVAPVNVIDYSFSNISLDNLRDVDLQYDASKYIVGIANFRYIGDPIQKVPAGGTKSIGNFVAHTFISGGTWHLEIRNQTLDLDPVDSVNYEVTVIVYDKSYFRYLAPIMTDLGGNNTGTASSVPNLY